MKVVFVGSHTLDVAEIATHALRQMASLPPETVILLRRGRSTQPGAFERFIVSMADSLGFNVEWKIPGRGKGASFIRDVEMVKEADSVIAYFSEPNLMTGGTGHVVDKAIDSDKPVFAYAPLDGAVERVGELEPA